MHGPEGSLVRGNSFWAFAHSGHYIAPPGCSEGAKVGDHDGGEEGEGEEEPQGPVDTCILIQGSRTGLHTKVDVPHSR